MCQAPVQLGNKLQIHIDMFIQQGVEPVWLEKGLFWLETNKMAEKNVKFPHR
jgi:hypothetical protein